MKTAKKNNWNSSWDIIFKIKLKAWWVILQKMKDRLNGQHSLLKILTMKCNSKNLCQHKMKSLKIQHCQSWKPTKRRRSITGTTPNKKGTFGSWKIIDLSLTRALGRRKKFAFIMKWQSASSQEIIFSAGVIIRRWFRNTRLSIGSFSAWKIQLCQWNPLKKMNSILSVWMKW